MNIGRGGGISRHAGLKILCSQECEGASPSSGTMGRKKLPQKNFKWTPQLAYGVGLIVTDGNLSGDGRHITMRSSEKQMLEIYKKAMGIQHINIGKSEANGYSKSPSYRVAHGDVQLYRWLEKIGITPNKTISIGSLNIPNNVFPDFLRGHLDGDGSITTYIDRWNTFKNPKYIYERLWVRFLSASKKHMAWLQNKIEKNYGFSGHLNSRKPKNPRRVPLYGLKFGKKESLKLLKIMYYDSNVPCLERKRKIAEKFIS